MYFSFVGDIVIKNLNCQPARPEQLGIKTGKQLSELPFVDKLFEKILVTSCGSLLNFYTRGFVLNTFGKIVVNGKSARKRLTRNQEFYCWAFEFSVLN